MKKSVDGNMAVSIMMHKITEFASIYPITPSSPMAEIYEKFSSEEKTNIYGTVPKCVEMQSEGGVAGTLHGALLSGAISTTFTSSQGLLLMIPNMYKIAGELLPCVINVAARSLATHALNIFGDYSDVMACKETGFAMLCASNVQECYDFALLSFIASFNSSIPFMHFFDGFRTSHEIEK
ncbi:MAG: pyruvate:ferredoxin (flavodoxin) oxidoreductase, partial [Christensenellales bacterium]